MGSEYVCAIMCTVQIIFLFISNSCTKRMAFEIMSQQLQQTTLTYMIHDSGIFCVRLYCTLHTSGAKALSGQKDSMVMVLAVPGVSFLLDKSPATDILQAPRRVLPFYKTDGLDKKIHHQQ